MGFRRLLKYMTHYGLSLNHANSKKTLIVVSAVAIVAVAVVLYMLFGGTMISLTSTIPSGTPYITEIQAASLIGSGGTYNLTIYTPSSGLARFLSSSGNSLFRFKKVFGRFICLGIKTDVY
jgi:hypothetical protein